MISMNLTKSIEELIPKTRGDVYRIIMSYRWFPKMTMLVIENWTTMHEAYIKNVMLALTDEVFSESLWNQRILRNTLSDIVSLDESPPDFCWDKSPPIKQFKVQLDSKRSLKRSSTWPWAAVAVGGSFVALDLLHTQCSSSVPTKVVKTVAELCNY